MLSIDRLQKSLFKNKNYNRKGSSRKRIGQVTEQRKKNMVVRAGIISQAHQPPFPHEVEPGKPFIDVERQPEGNEDLGSPQGQP
jgi:hypothetical protein